MSSCRDRRSSLPRRPSGSLGQRKRPTPRGEKLFTFLASLLLERLYGTVTIRFESAKVTHVEMETRRSWQYKDLPDETRAAKQMAGAARALAAALTGK
jgi:hypothetical protein